MPAQKRFPITVREQSVTVKIYRQAAPSNASGFSYVVAWVGGSGRERQTFADLGAAETEAASKAAQLAAGLAQSNLLSRGDVLELTESRALVAPLGVPLLSAVAEWAKARQLAGPALLEACSAWAERRTSKVKRIEFSAAVDEFIAAKNAAKKRGSKTYSSKLKPAKAFFGDAFLDTITAQEWTRYLIRIAKGRMRVPIDEVKNVTFEEGNIVLEIGRENLIGRKVFISVRRVPNGVFLRELVDALRPAAPFAHE